MSEMSTSFVIIIKDRQVSIRKGEAPEDQVLSWPIMTQTEKAWLVEFPGGNVWLPQWRFDRKPMVNITPSIIATGLSQEYTAGDFLRKLRSLMEASNDGEVKVKFIHEISDKASKYQIHIKSSIEGEADGVIERLFTKRLILPDSQVRKSSTDTLYAQPWVIENKLQSHEIALDCNSPLFKTIEKEIAQAVHRYNKQKRSTEKKKEIASNKEYLKREKMADEYNRKYPDIADSLRDEGLDNQQLERRIRNKLAQISRKREAEENRRSEEKKLIRLEGLYAGKPLVEVEVKYFNKDWTVYWEKYEGVRVRHTKQRIGIYFGDGEELMKAPHNVQIKES